MEKQIEELLRKANGGIDTLTSKYPQLLEDYITYKVIWSIAEPLVLVVLMTGIMFIGRKMGAEKESMFKDIWYMGRWHGGAGAPLWAMTIVLGIFTVVSIAISIHTLTLISINPELYIIQKFLTK